jgi:epoxyqueuosine reductase QueG
LSYIPTGRYTKPPPIPADIASAWGRRLYGCTRCQDACPHNKKPLPGVSTEEGPLPAHLDGRELLILDDAALKARFRGSALGMTWLTPDILRRSITTALAGEIHPKNAQP